MSENRGLEFIILGCGSSGGVPRIDGNWGVCNPQNPKNYRTRCSLAVKFPTGKVIVFDTAPEIRLQFLKAGLHRLDAVFYTHDHADQVHGIDDVRAFTYADKQQIPCYADKNTMAILTQRFDYIFQEKSNSGYPALMNLQEMPSVLYFQDICIKSYPCTHGRIQALGYQIDKLFYSPDVNLISDSVLAILAQEQLKIWVVDCLRYRPHPTHAHLEQVLAWHKIVKPKKMVLTNLHIDMDYDILAQELPAGIVPAYDGMILSL